MEEFLRVHSVIACGKENWVAGTQRRDGDKQIPLSPVFLLFLTVRILTHGDYIPD